MKICVIGLGYVGLPLAYELSSNFEVTGYDNSPQRISELKARFDRTGEVSASCLRNVDQLIFTNDVDDIKDCSVYIVTVPTPIDISNNPDLSALIDASKLVGNIIDTGDTVIYESTVYPGTTEEICIPILEQQSRLTLDKDFGVGYSPERINPGDKLHTLGNVVKVISASNDKTLIKIKKIYESIVHAGLHIAPNIKTAEAAKVIENTQRDLNIGLINELAIIFDALEIDTMEVLDAASTKWNFINFRPGLVGGHCIGVDPYYLTYRAEQCGLNPELILAGRRVNNAIPQFIAMKVVKHLIHKNNPSNVFKVLLLGMTFKENCPDTRNSKSFELKDELVEFGIKVNSYDPYCDDSIDIQRELSLDQNDAVILAVPHLKILDLLKLEQVREYREAGGLFFDIKSVFPKEESDWRL